MEVSGRRSLITEEITDIHMYTAHLLPADAAGDIVATVVARQQTQHVHDDLWRFQPDCSCFCSLHLILL